MKYLPNTRVAEFGEGNAKDFLSSEEERGISLPPKRWYRWWPAMGIAFIVLLLLFASIVNP